MRKNEIIIDKDSLVKKEASSFMRKTTFNSSNSEKETSATQKTDIAKKILFPQKRYIW